MPFSLSDLMVTSFVGTQALVAYPHFRHTCRRPLDTPTPMAFQPPHSANRHDAGCRGAGPDRRRVKMTSELSDHVSTVKELLESAAEA